MLSPIIPKSNLVLKTCVVSNQIIFESENGMLRISVYDKDILRISYTDRKIFEEEQGEEFLPPKKDIKLDFLENEKEFTISTSELECKVLKAESSVSFVRKADGKCLFTEAKNYPHHLESFEVYKNTGNIQVEEIKTADGVKKRIKAADKELDKILYHTRLDFCFDEDEKIYGLGQAEEGCWNLRHTTQYLNQANKKIAIPFFISNKGYGVLLSTQSPSIFNDNQYGTYFYTTADYYLDYFFIAPEKKSQIIAGMRKLTGKALIPPKWAFGYVQSQERYESQQEILDTAAEFKKRGIPLSTIVLDWLSWDDGMWGQKSFDAKRFPDPEKMVETLHKDDVHFMISIWPSMDEKCQNYQEMKAAGTLLNGVNICNAFDKKARDLYWKQAKEGLADKGIESWWCDSSEPITPEWNHLEYQLPEINFNEYVKTALDVMPVEKSNAYGYYHAMGMYEGQKKDFPERRMLILTRNGYFGSQKFGVTLWSGDISASWKTLQNQLVAAIQFSLSGIPYWTFDIGGFFVKKGINWYWNGDYNNTTANAGYRELYTRWLQLGCFLPMFRAHGTDCRREPWAFEDDSNIFYNTIVDSIKLRYKLMPYIYSAAAKVWLNDEMFIRPLFTEFEDPKCEEISTQFMFGPSLMVCPVTTPMYYDKDGNALPDSIEKKISVYLPEGSDWYDWWSGEKYCGRQKIVVDAPISRIPLFVKAGAIIPTADKVLRFPGKDGNCIPFELYEDSGDGYDYLEGDYKISLLK